ncbi:BQ2448_4553 [Microbotryum intermedium]|uniref:BQ2448_4553 protein n=1 Tax=Microbotryum intermedium TaxID=269621 RepID=A0A238FGD7_9BASI|nr:BQ2448_4553 [Microbotryum intermedium]
MSCSGVRTALAECLLKTDCVLKSEPARTPHECLQHHSDELPIECQQLRKAFFECKRGMLDMRKRFRGIEPASTKVSPVATDEIGRPS